MEKLKIYLANIKGTDTRFHSTIILSEKSIQGINLKILIKPYTNNSLLLGFKLSNDSMETPDFIQEFEKSKFSNIYKILEIENYENYTVTLGRIYLAISNFITQTTKILKKQLLNPEPRKSLGEKRVAIEIKDFEIFIEYFGVDIKDLFCKPFYLFIKYKEFYIKVKILDFHSEANTKEVLIEVKGNYVHSELLGQEIRMCFLRWFDLITK